MSVKNKFQCQGKFRFGKFNLASKSASRLAHRINDKMHAYACNQCGGFHVGHTN